MPATLDRLAGLLERERSLTASLRAALIYPALLVVAAIGSIVLLLDYVLPQFTPIFEQAGAQLPTATRVLMTLGTIVGAALPWFLAALLVGGLVARHLLTQPAYRLPFDRLLLRLPIAGSLIRETLAARLTRTLGSLLDNGVPLIPALGIAKEALGNLAAAAAVEAAALRAKGGAGLARPLAAAGVFPARTIHLLQLGEEAAQLAAMSLKAADIHDEQARLMMQRLVALAVPLITITMGLAVAGIISALLTAMLSLNDLGEVSRDRRRPSGLRGAIGKPNGFSLIELLVVLAVMGFALVLIVGYKAPWSSALGLEGTAAELASGLRLARSQAIADNQPVMFARFVRSSLSDR